MKKNLRTRPLTWRKLGLMVLLGLGLATATQAQTTLIDPSGDGGFETGATFTENGWTVSNSANNPWVVGTAVSSGAITGNSAYISNTSGTTNAYSNTTSTSNYFWRDVTVPAGAENVLELSFNWISNGEASWDLWQVFTSSTSITPAAAASHPGSGTSNIPTAISGATFVGFGQSQTGVQTANYILPASLAGTTFRLIFLWKNDGSGGSNPPAVIDNISLTARAPINYVSVATGNWNASSTWSPASTPTASDNATISAGHTVSVNATSLSINNLTVSGTLGYTTTPTSFNVNGNLTVNSGGQVNVFASTTGKTLLVSGNITNNGSIDISVGSTTAGNLTLNGSTVQTVSGSGTFNNGFIRNLSFTNTNTSIPNIIWSLGDLTVAYNLSISSAKINMGTSTLTFGNNAAGNTLTVNSGAGLLPGAKFARWWTTTVTGSAFTAGSNPSTATSQYPFINASGHNRSFWIRRTSSTATGNTAGLLTVEYQNSTTVTSGLSINDNGYTVTNRFDGNWIVTVPGSYAYTSGTHQVAAIAEFAYSAKSGNSRIVYANDTIAGTTHQNGTTTPGAQRLGFTTATLTAAPLYIGMNTGDINKTAVASGNWNNPATWSGNTVPGCSDTVVILSGITVTVNSAANEVRRLTIDAGGTLVVASGDLTTGCVTNNNVLSNSGTITVSGGTLNINGQLLVNSGATFNQSGGNINIDVNGNSAASSVAAGTASFQLNSNLGTVNGGTITIVDPNFNASGKAFDFSTTSGGHMTWEPPHTLVLGNGSSTDSSANTNGFILENYTSSGRLMFGNLTINGGNGTNRWTSLGAWSINVKGDLTVNANSVLRLNSGSTAPVLAGNIINNGTLISTVAITLGSLNGSAVIAASSAQSISGSGTFANALSSSTASLTGLTVNNTSSGGVTLNVPLSISGTLTMTRGLINTTSTNLLSLGTATAAGTLSGTNSDSNMIVGPFERTFAASRTASGTYNATTLFPVGKGSVYAPIHIDPSTNSNGAVELSAEFFTSHSGTAGSGVSNLSAVNWSTSATAGSANLTNVYGRVTHSGVDSSKKLLHASTANGIYNGTPGGSLASGTDKTITTSAAIAAADILGFYAYGNLTPCSAPTDTATNFATSLMTTTSFTGSFTAATGSPTGYLVVCYTTAQTPVDPTDGVVYSGSALGGTVVANLTASPFSFTQTGLTAGTQYDYRVYSYNNSGCAGPTYLTSSRLNTSVTTCATAVGAPGTPSSTNVTTTSMDINWTASSTADVTYIVDVATNSGFTSFLTGYEGFDNDTSRTLSLSGLSSSTTYFVRVRAVAPNNCVSNLSSTGNLTTSCVASSIPYTEDFESVTVPAMPNCTQVINAGSGNSWTTASNPGSGFTTKVLQYSYSNSADANTWFFTNGLDLTGGKSYRLTFNYGNNSTSYEERLRVTLGTAASVAGVTDTLIEFPSINQNAIQSASLDFVAPGNGIYNIGFQAYSAADEWKLYVDNISITETPINTWNGTGLWNNVANWSLGFEPATDKDAIIASGTVTTDANTNVKALTINSGAAVVVDAGHVMTVTGGITNNGTITVKATSATSFGQLMVSGNTSGSGTAKFERAVTGTTAGWRLISSPTNANFNSFGPSPVLVGPANILTLNANSPNTWEAINGVGTATVEAGRGYLVYLGNGGVNNNSASHTFSLNGTSINTSNVSVNGLSDGNGTNTFGWSVVGNPFGTNLTWDTTANTRTNIDNAYYVWDATSGGGTGAYASYVSGVSNPSNALSNYIAPLQGFLVKANAASPALTLAAGARNTGMTNAQLRTSNLFDILRLRAAEVNGSRWDEATFVSRAGATAGFDSDFDAFKLMNFDATAPNLFSKATTGEVLSINAFAEITGPVSIPVHFVAGTNGNYSITLDAAQLGTQHTVTLEDLKTGLRHDMRSGAYSFAHLTSNANDRFVLHLNASTVSVNNGTENPVRVYTYNNHLYVSGLGESELVKSLRVLDITGKVVVNESALHADEVRERPLNLPAGTYMIQVVTDMGIKNVKVILGM